jgi:hypothetical protein
MGGPFLRVLFLLLASVVMRSSLWAQSLPCSQQTVPVSVSDPVGRVALGLSTSNFRVQVHGHRSAIINAKMDSSPRRIVLLLDASGSMIESKNSIWRPALMIARSLVQSLPPEDSLAFLAFASQRERSVDFTQQSKAVLQQLNDLQPGTTVIPKDMRDTALWDSVLEALRLLDPPRVGDSIYLISDGDDNHSKAHARDVQTALLVGKVRLFVLLPPGLNLAMLSRTYLSKSREAINPLRDLQDLADATGGALFPLYEPWINEVTGIAVPLTATELQVSINQVNVLTHQFYRAEIELSQPLDKSENLRLEVEGQPHKGKLPLLLRYPRKLMPCSAREN